MANRHNKEEMYVQENPIQVIHLKAVHNVSKDPVYCCMIWTIASIQRSIQAAQYRPAAAIVSALFMGGGGAGFFALLGGGGGTFRPFEVVVRVVWLVVRLIALP